jgi:hypothetical protein
MSRAFFIAASLATASVFLFASPACCQKRPAAKATPRPLPKPVDAGWYDREIRTRQAERRADDHRDLRRRQARARYQADEAWKDDLDEDIMDDDSDE